MELYLPIMPDMFRTFQKFNDPELAEQIAGMLRGRSIACEVVDNNQNFGPGIVNVSDRVEFELKVQAKNFAKVNEVMNDFYKGQLDAIDKDYYLFGLSDKELEEVVAKPDEWGRLNYQLAQKILKDRGREITPQKAELLREERTVELAKAETTPRGWILLGYLSAVFGGIFGIVIGWVLGYFKKTLPNGQKVYTYQPNIRKHGRIILFVSIISIGIWYMLRIYWFVYDLMGLNFHY